MASVLGVFGIDWHLLVINLINFSILLGALTYFLYRPITKTLDTRREKVAQGVKDAEMAAQHLKDIEAAETERMTEAAATAEKLIADARAVALAKEHEIVARGETAATAMLSEAKLQAAELQREAITKSKEEVAKLIVLGMERTMKTQK